MILTMIGDEDHEFGLLFNLTYQKYRVISTKFTAGVNRDLSPKAPISDITPYGVHDATYRKHTVSAALAMRISADSTPEAWLDLRESTFIFFACSL